MIGIVGAMEVEINGLRDKMENVSSQVVGMDTFYSGNLFGKDTVLTVCGPGKVNAAISTQNMIHMYKPEYVINIGAAGSGIEQMNVGDMVIATAAVQHDMDTSPIGDPVGFVSKIGLVNIPCDDGLREALVKAAESIGDLKVWQGIIATGDQFISDGERRKRIHDLFDASAVEMEGAAVAHVCYANHVPCGVLRSVSDKANGEAEMDYPTFVSMAAEHAQKVIEAFLKEN